MQTTNIMKPQRKGISGSMLKIIAMVCMLLDHIALFVIDRMLIQGGLYEVSNEATAQLFMQSYGGWYQVSEIFRILGRIAFPVFCFLLVEGFIHTHNLKKYLTRLFLFALISEIPFNLAISGKLFLPEAQNVYFTLFLGVVALVGIRMVEENKEWHKGWRVLVAIMSVVLCASIAILLKSDYDMLGILVIAVIYVLRSNQTLAMGLGCAVLMNLPSFLSMLPVHLYNGKRGSNIKWLFYLFYPVHILLLYWLAYIMGLGHISFI